MMFAEPPLPRSQAVEESSDSQRPFSLHSSASEQPGALSLNSQVLFLPLCVGESQSALMTIDPPHSAATSKQEDSFFHVVFEKT